MFHRHFDGYVRHGHGPGGFGRGPFGGWRGRHGGGFERREGRMFDGGELRLVILALVAEKPRYGYEVIKELGERVGGEYSPSPGVVYPTLTMLEEMGYASASQDPQGRKLYTLTGEGEKVLADNKAEIDAIFARFGDSDEGRFAGFVSVKRAMLNLRATLRLRLRGRAATPPQIQAIVDALDAAAKAIERVWQAAPESGFEAEFRSPPAAQEWQGAGCESSGRAGSGGVTRPTASDRASSCCSRAGRGRRGDGGPLFSPNRWLPSGS